MRFSDRIRFQNAAVFRSWAYISHFFKFDQDKNVYVYVERKMFNVWPNKILFLSTIQGFVRFKIETVLFVVVTLEKYFHIFFFSFVIKENYYTNFKLTLFKNKNIKNIKIKKLLNLFKIIYICIVSFSAEADW